MALAWGVEVTSVVGVSSAGIFVAPTASGKRSDRVEAIVMKIRTVTPVQRPASLRGALPRYQVFDRRESPPMTVARFYRDPAYGDFVVFEVYDDIFREFLKEPTFEGKRFFWMIDVDADAPHDTRRAIVRSHPSPAPVLHGDKSDPQLTLDEAVEACRSRDYHWVVRASDPV
jgi:hypothetical protein